MAYPVSWSCPSCGSVNANAIKCTVCSYAPPGESGSLNVQSTVSNLLKERVIAFLFDVIFISVFALFISGGVALSLSFSVNKDFNVLFNLFSIPVFLISLIAHPFYFLVFEARYGKTYGKKLMHIKVVCSNGKISWSLSFKRNLMRFVEALTLYIISIVMIKTNGKRLGDRIAGTYVVKD